MNRKHILSVMETDAETSLKALHAAVADVVNASYIIVTGKVSKLLQIIAGSRPLYEYLSEQTRGYNFVEEFRSRQFRDEYGRPYIDVTQEPQEQMRFAFCLLFAVDTNKLNLENLLHTFYNDSDPNTELRNFCAEIVQPFADNLTAAFCAEDAQVEQESEPYAADAAAATEFGDAFSAQTYAPVTDAPVAPSEGAEMLSADDSLLASLRDVVSEMIGVIAKDDELSLLRREELLLVCDAFSTAIGVKETRAVRVMFIALKNTLLVDGMSDALEEKYNDLTYLLAGLGIQTEE